jgi:hypothetical protein
MSKSDKEGILRMQPSGCSVVCRPGQAPVEITSGDVFRLEDPGKEGLHRTRTERDTEGYYSVHGYHLHDERHGPGMKKKPRASLRARGDLTRPAPDLGMERRSGAACAVNAATHARFRARP